MLQEEFPRKRKKDSRVFHSRSKNGDQTVEHISLRISVTLSTTSDKTKLSKKQTNGILRYCFITIVRAKLIKKQKNLLVR